MIKDDEPFPSAEELESLRKAQEKQQALELEIVRARVVKGETLEEYVLGVLRGYEELERFASELGAVAPIWSRIDEIERRHGFLFGAHYFYDFEVVEYYHALPLEPSQLGQRWIRSGAKILAGEVELFSADWYLCHAFQHLLRCIKTSGVEQLREAFLFGKALAEGNWKERSEDVFAAGKREKMRSEKAGAGGGDSSSQRRLRNLEAVMVEIETMSHLVGQMSDERILSQAFDNVAAKKPGFPKARKTRENYETTLRSDQQFKARYQAVFMKSA